MMGATRKFRGGIVILVGILCLFMVLGLPGDSGAASGKKTAQIEPLVSIAAKVRMVGILDPTKIAAFFPDQSSARASEVFSMSLPDQESPEVARALWSSFFRGSQIFLGLAGSDHPLIGFYNPIADSWLVTAWAVGEKDGSLIMSRSWLMLGEDLVALGAPIEDVPPWGRTLLRKSLVKALHEQSRRAADAFAEHYPVEDTADLPEQPDQQKARSLTFERLATFEQQQIEFTADTEFSAVFEQLAKAIEAGDAKGLAEHLPNRLAAQADRVLQLPETLRQSLVPLLVLRHADDAVLVFATPTQARVVLLAEIKRSSTGRIEVNNLGMMDLYGGET